jgi:hypothetical protein
MAKLPFVVAPRVKPEMIEIGNQDTCGTIKIERRGYVTAGEKAFISAQLAEDNSTNLVLSLSREAATYFKVDVQTAYEAVVDCFGDFSDNPLTVKIQKKYKEEVSALFGSMIATDERRRLMEAYCMILYRINGDFSADELFELDPELIKALSDHYRSEDGRTNEVVAGKEEDSSEKTNFEDYQKK